MPCQSDYTRATERELVLSRVACLLDELDGKQFKKSDLIIRSRWNGYHPRVYNQRLEDIEADKMVAELCQKIQSVNVKDYSLEMQIWWRDHQIADKRRLEEELRKIKEQKDKEIALTKLTPYERELLGIGE